MNKLQNSILLIGSNPSSSQLNVVRLREIEKKSLTIRNQLRGDLKPIIL